MGPRCFEKLSKVSSLQNTPLLSMTKSFDQFILGFDVLNSLRHVFSLRGSTLHPSLTTCL